MSHANVQEQRAQASFREWDEVLASLPNLRDRRVLDLGCGIGTFSARLAAAGAEVIGVDDDDDALAVARASHPQIRFEKHDVCSVTRDTFGHVDGIVGAFVVAFVADLADVLDRWDGCLRSGGWMALIEVDDLLGHEPVDPEIRADIEGFYGAARASGGYDFLCARRLASLLGDRGFVVGERPLRDDELAFVGPASADVLAAWEARFARMSGLRRHFGARSADVEHALLAAMRSPKHRSRASVRFVQASRGHRG